MGRVKDTRTVDMFVIPQPERPEPGSADYAFQISNIVSAILKDCPLDRFEISAQMSRLTGKDVSKNMIDAWASAGRPDHNIPLYLVAVFETVCGSHALTDWLVHKRGGRVAYGKDTLNEKLGIALLKKQKADAEYKQLQKMMENME
ncbi:MAG TPA: hypothetical protein ENK06_13125 [Gammaproteobacteria bacterium]|nr:hypothetical protein [Gammaproteobacteria bacterium]